MKNTLLFLTLLAAGAVALPAVAQSNDGFFINGSAGRADVNHGQYDDHDTAWNLNTGYRWAISPSAQFGLEAGYANLGKFGSTSQDIFGKARLKGWTAGVNTNIDITPDWYFAARGGYFHSDMRSGVYFQPGDADAVPHYLDVTSDGWYLGAGFGYNTSEHTSVGLHYDRYEASRHNFKLNPDVWSVRMEYQF